MRIPHYDIISSPTGRFVGYWSTTNLYCYEVVWPKPLQPSTGGGGGLVLTTAELPCGVAEEDPDMAQTLTDDWVLCLRQVEDAGRQQQQQHEEMMRQLQAQLEESERLRIAAEGRNEEQARQYLREQEELRRRIDRESDMQRELVTQALRELQERQRDAARRKAATPPPPSGIRKEPDAPRNLGSINPVPRAMIDTLRDVAANRAVQAGIAWAWRKITGDDKKGRRKKK